MANGIFAVTARRPEEPAAKQVWRTVASLEEQPRSRTRDYQFASPHHSAGIRTREKAQIVGGEAKRWFDVTMALLAILALLPLFCLIALAIKLWDRGPVFYRHRRIGLNGDTFDCLKFRTMVVDADTVFARHLATNSEAAREWEENQKLKDDPRVTPLGLSLRRTSLDELPQLLNIVRGEMSLVGPRPIVSAEVPKYGSTIGQYFCARPGLTGPWQVSGRNDVTYATRVALDRDYVENWTFRRDLAIVAKTIRVVVSARGCY